MNSGGEWTRVRNLGPVSIEQLAAVGITNPEQLSSVGAVAAYLRLKRTFPDRINRTMLWALAGAELGLDWRDVPPDIKDQLQAELLEHETRTG
jgi:DNA transformation protein